MEAAVTDDKQHLSINSLLGNEILFLCCEAAFEHLTLCKAHLQLR